MHRSAARRQFDIIQNGVAAFFQPGCENAAGSAFSDIAPETGRQKKSDDQYKRYYPD
jgi:hypothetical protein